MLLLYFFLLFFCITGHSEAAAARPFTPQDLITAPKASGFTVSPDGQSVVYIQSTYDPETNNKTKSVQLLNLQNGQSSDITKLIDKSEIGDLVWLNSQEIAFVADDEHKVPQIYVSNLFCSNCSLTQASNFNYTSISALKYSPVNNLLIFSTKVSVKNLDTNRFSSAKIYDQLYVRHWDEWYEYKHQHVHAFSLAKSGQNASDGAARDLMTADPLLESPIRPYYEPECLALSPDGEEVAFVSRPVTRTQAWKSKLNLYLLPTNGGPTKPVSITDEFNGALSNPVYSPDGKYIVWLQMYDPINESDRNRIILYNRRTGTKTVLASKWDSSPGSVAFSPDSSTLYLTSVDRVHTKIYKLAVDSKPLDNPVAIASEGTFSVLGVFSDKIVATRNSFTSPNEVYTVSLDGNSIAKISSINDHYLSNFELIEPEIFNFTGAKNENVEGFIFKSLNFAPNLKYPLVFWIHGGPESAFGNSWSERWNYQLPSQAGYILVSINFHGSNGYGTNFTESILNNWGNYPFKDLMKGLDFALQAYPFIDERKMCAWGASYGGYMINFINGHTNRFKCLVTHDGVFDSSMGYFTTEELYFMENEFGGTPWSNPEIYRKWSPSTYVENWRTPTLVVHGGKDYRLVDGNGLAVFTALQRQGIPSKLVYFEDENHWVLKPANSLVWHKELFEWTKYWTNAKTTWN